MKQAGVVIVGAGAGGTSAAGTLRKAGYAGKVTVVRGEGGRPYNRTTVNKGLLQGLFTVDDVILPDAFISDIEWTGVDHATTLDAAERTVTLASGRSLRYEELVIATGAFPRPFPGRVAEDARERVLTLRTARDAQRLRRWVAGANANGTSRRPRITILGAGLIGSETAGVLTAAGAEVSLVSLSAAPMSEHLGEIAGAWLKGKHQDQLHTYFGRTVIEAHMNEANDLVATLADGEPIVSDILLTCIGVAPNTGWLRDTALDTSDGVAVDERLRVRGAPAVYAAGDVARITDNRGHGRRVEHWGNATAQGRHAALTLLYDNRIIAEGPGAFGALPGYSTQLYGTKLTVVGHPHAFTNETVIDGDPAHGRFTVALTDRDYGLVRVIGVGGARLANALKPAVLCNQPLGSALAAAT